MEIEDISEEDVPGSDVIDVSLIKMEVRSKISVKRLKNKVLLYFFYLLMLKYPLKSI